MGIADWVRSVLVRLGLRAPEPVEAPRRRAAAPAAPVVTPAPEPDPAPPRVEAARDKAGPAGDEGEVDFLEGVFWDGAHRIVLKEDELPQVERVAAALRKRFAATAIEAHPFPARSSRIFALLDDPDFDIERLVQLTQRDPALSASVLRVANSAAYASQGEIESVREAIMRIGAETVAGIAAALSTRGVFDSGAKTARGVLREAWSDAWLHSVSSAFSAGTLCLDLRRGDLERCFLGGMLHDIGKTFALRDFSAAWAEIGEEAAPPRRVVSAAVEDVHVELGVAAVKAWKLPAFLNEVCEKHHAPDEPADVEVAIIRLASGLAAIHLSPYYRQGLTDELRSTAKALGLGPLAVRAHRSRMRTSIEKAQAL